MKRLDFSHVKKPESPSETLKRPFFRVTVASAALLAGLIGASPVLLPNRASAQDTSTHLISTTQPKVLDSALTKLVTVPLTEIQKLNSQTAGMPGSIGKGIFTAIAWLDYPKESIGDTISVVAQICQTAGCYGSGLPDKLVQVVSGSKKILATIDLKQLNELYKKATGKEFKFVKLVTDNGTDAQMGPYASVYVIPIEGPDAEIKGGTPVLWIGCPSKTKEVYSGPNLIAMR
jgi:hypothetical protein